MCHSQTLEGHTLSGFEVKNPYKLVSQHFRILKIILKMLMFGKLADMISHYSTVKEKMLETMRFETKLIVILNKLQQH